MPVDAIAVDAIAGPATVSLSTSDGERLAGCWVTSDVPSTASVVLVHGFTASAADPQVSGIAAALAGAGYDVLTYDARGHGSSSGLCTLGDDEQFDVAAAVAAARASHERVIVVGASMGAIAAIRHAAASPVDGVVVVSCPARWRLHSPQAALGALMTRTRPGRAVLRRLAGTRVATRWTNPSPPLALIGQVGCPVAVIHGTSDRFIPAAEARRLHAAALGRRQLTLVEGMGHAYDPKGFAAIVDAVRWTSR